MRKGNAVRKWWSYIDEAPISKAEKNAIYGISMSEIEFADPKGLSHYSTSSKLTIYMKETRKFVLRKIQYLIWLVFSPKSDYPAPELSMPSFIAPQFAPIVPNNAYDEQEHSNDNDHLSQPLPPVTYAYNYDLGVWMCYESGAPEPEHYPSGMRMPEPGLGRFNGHIPLQTHERLGHTRMPAPDHGIRMPSPDHGIRMPVPGYEQSRDQFNSMPQPYPQQYQHQQYERYQYPSEQQQNSEPQHGQIINRHMHTIHIVGWEVFHKNGHTYQYSKYTHIHTFDTHTSTYNVYR